MQIYESGNWSLQLEYYQSCLEAKSQQPGSKVIMVITVLSGWRKINAANVKQVCQKLIEESVVAE